MTTYKKILVAIDINAQYKAVIDKALSICPSKEALNLIYVPLPMVYINPYLYGMDYSAVNDTDRSERAKQKLDDIAKEFGIESQNVYLKTGDAADEIKQIANEIHADVIVIGTHGRSGIKLLLGSTANAVLHGVEQDVLAVRIREDD